MLFALISATRDVKTSELYRLKPALEQNARHCAEAHMISEPIGVEVIDRESALPKGCYPVVFVDDTADSATLAQHWFDPARDIPASRVLVENTTGLNDGEYSGCEAASHEMLEILLNPKVATWTAYPRRDGVEVIYEIADPCQDHYTIRVGNTDWKVSNFVTPFWFMSRLPQPLRVIEQDFGFGLDWSKTLTQPGEIGPKGYALLRERGPDGQWRKWSQGSDGPIGQNSAQFARKQHHASRTQRILAAK